MKRRTFIRAAAFTGVSAALAGCTGGGNDGPAPRQSEVVNEVTADGTQLSIDLESEAIVESRAEVGSEKQSMNEDGVSAAIVDDALALYANLGIIGTAAAKGRGRGASAASAKGRHGRPKWAGGGFVAWRDDHEDEIEEYPAHIVGIGVAFLAGASAGEDSLPGPGPVPWDKQWVAGNSNFSKRNSGDQTDDDSEEETTETDDNTGSGGDDTDSGAQSTTEDGSDNETTESGSDGGSGTETVTVDAEKVNGEDIAYDFSRVGWYRIGTHLVHPNGKYDFGWESIDVLVERDDTGSYKIAEKWKVSPRL